MMFGYGHNLWWGLVMMLVPLAILGLIAYWAVYSGVKNGLKNKSSE
ncbi:MAG: hypothetical protein ACOY46_18265 [Bacillota bacterium]